MFVFFICIINRLVILQDHVSQPHTGYNKPFGHLEAVADKNELPDINSDFWRPSSVH